MHSFLKENRKKMNYTCLNMATKLNISKTYYWQIENGKRTLTYEMAYKIGKILKIKPDKLFYKDFENIK